MDVNTVVKGILSIRERIAKAWENPDELSDLGNKLAQYNAYLGDHLGKYEEDRELQRGSLYLKLINEGQSATAAENQARAEIAELTGNVKKLQLMHKDAETQISMLQSRLKVLEGQRRGDF